MQYLLLLATLVLLAPPARAQTASVPAEAGACRYCALVVDDYLRGGTNRRQLYSGRLDAKQPADAALGAANRQIIKARDVIFALNCLSDLGWDCFSVANVPYTASSGSRSSETRYLSGQSRSQR